MAAVESCGTANPPSIPIRMNATRKTFFMNLWRNPPPTSQGGGCATSFLYCYSDVCHIERLDELIVTRKNLRMCYTNNMRNYRSWRSVQAVNFAQSAIFLSNYTKRTTKNKRYCSALLLSSSSA